jgi:hypothetical protein
MCAPNVESFLFLLLNPDLFYFASAGQRKRQCPYLFFGVVFMTFFSFQPFFLSLKGVMEVFSELKIPKPKGHLLNPGKSGPL